MCLMARSFVAVELAYRAFSFLPRAYQKYRSLRACPGGSAALSCHWIIRDVCVIVPSFSAMWAAGMNQTSVPTLAGSDPATAFQNAADSVSERSGPPSHSRFSMAFRWKVELMLVAGFWPVRIMPLILP